MDNYTRALVVNEGSESIPCLIKRDPHSKDCTHNIHTLIDGQLPFTERLTREVLCPELTQRLTRQIATSWTIRQTVYDKEDRPRIYVRSIDRCSID